MIKLTNPNYCATVVQINKLIPLDNCDNIQYAIIMGNSVVVSKETNVGDIGLFFPVETQLSNIYLSSNNLYREKELNVNKNKSGFFEKNGRIRCVKLRGNKSEGLFMPINSINNLGLLATDLEGSDLDIDLKVGSEFNEIFGIEICKKYEIERKISQSSSNKVRKSLRKKSIEILENQFRFHIDTSQLYKNLHQINPEKLISITYKLHGTSGISSKLLVKKKLNLFEKILFKLNVNIKTEEYKLISASRSVIKSETSDLGFYGEDLWKISTKYLEEFLINGMTLYYEIVGFTPSGKYIQKGFDYGCILPENNEYIEGVNYKIFIYRITLTNNEGKVFEFSAKQVQDWCKKNGLNPVPELYYGYAKNFFSYFGLQDDLEKWRNDFLNVLKKQYNEKDCYMCRNIVPEEGCVLRIENLDIESYKCKSTRFLEKETKELDLGEVNIESQN